MGVAPLLEKDIKRQIIQWFQLQRDTFVWVNVSGGIWDVNSKYFRKLNGFGMLKGVSDILGIYRMKPLAIEVKRPGGKLSNDQLNFLSHFNMRGGIGFVATCIEDCIRELQKRGYEV